MSTTPISPRRAALVLIAILATGGCATNPVTGASDFVLMSEDQELALGRQASREVAQEYRRYDDPALQRYVAQVGERLATHSHRPDLVYHFTVLDSTDVNAFSLPGGYVYINRGLLAQLETEAELAAVLGHEIGHVTARHAVRRYTAQQAAGIGYALGSILVPELRGAGSRQLFDLLGGALIRGYGRDQELEADELGAEYLARTGYDPHAIIEVLKVLKADETYDAEVARAEGRKPRAYHGVFATHPDNDTRLHEVVARAGALVSRKGGRVGRETYLHAIDGLTYGPSAAEGVLRGNVFYHRDLDFAVRFPEGWRVENRPDRLLAHSPAGDALEQVVMVDRNRRMSPREFMERRLGLTSLAEGRSVYAGELPGYTGTAVTDTPFGRRTTRFTVVYLGERAFVFAATRRDAAERHRYRTEFLNTALSLHALTDEERALAGEHHLRIVTAGPGERYETLAKGSPLGPRAEALLRLLNHQYPSGEPVEGMLLKIVE